MWSLCCTSGRKGEGMPWGRIREEVIKFGRHHVSFVSASSCRRVRTAKEILAFIIYFGTQVSSFTIRWWVLGLRMRLKIQPVCNIFLVSGWTRYWALQRWGGNSLVSSLHSSAVSALKKENGNKRGSEWGVSHLKEGDGCLLQDYCKESSRHATMPKLEGEF